MNSYNFLWTADMDITVIEIILNTGMAEDAGVTQDTAHYSWGRGGKSELGRGTTNSLDPCLSITPWPKELCKEFEADIPTFW